MAAFSASNLVAAQLIIEQEFAKHEMREQVLPALKLGLSYENNYLNGRAEDYRKREDRTVYGYYMKRRTAAVGSSRTATHTGLTEDSVQVALTWVTYSRTFSISLKQFDTNVFSYNDGFVQGIKNAILDIHAQIESDTVANLLTYKNQVVSSSTPFGGTSRASFNSTNNSWEIAAGDATRFYQIAKTVMQYNKFNQDRFDIIADGNKQVDAQYYASQGTGNYQNLAFQFAGMNPVFSPNLSDSNYPNGTSLVMPEGSFALIPWIPKQNRQGHGDYNSYLGGYGQMQDPFGLNLQYAVHGYTARTDTSSTNGVAQDDLLQIELSVDVAFVNAPLSTSNASTIYQFSQL